MITDTLEYIKPDTTAVEDTVHLPSPLDNFFSLTSKLWNGDASVNSLGESGVPIPYSLIHDNFIIISLLVCVILTAIFWTLSRGFLTYQFFNLLNTPREGGARLRETIRQKKHLRYFTLQCCFLTALMSYIFIVFELHISFSIPSCIVISVFSIIILFSIFLTGLIHDIPHSVYFELKQRRLYHTERSTFLAYYGLLLLPFAICTVFIGHDIVTICEILLFCLCFVKIIEISKLYGIFFRKNGRFLHFFLYLCTLEAVPILLTVGILTFSTLILIHSGK